LDLNELEVQELKRVSKHLRWAISPYYLSLIDFNNYAGSPIFKQAVPSLLELRDYEGKDDPMGEEMTNPAPRITRRYPDRLIINVTNQCGMYCRHCQRRRNFGETDRHARLHELKAALEYIRSNREIRDVLITGGDALMLNDKTIDWLLGELDSISHVEIKRLGTRALVTIPQRITPDLCQILKKHPPIFINTQFNSPLEITPESKLACDRLIEAGVVLGNQTVLLKGINDDVHVMKKLNQELLKIRVRPYYIFQAKEVKGARHFIAPVQKGLEIVKHLRGYTSGLAVPTYVINAPDGYGKTPVNPEYVLDINENQVQIKTWQGKIFNYPNHQ
jgi:glutamate 2,3-aminomutase